MAPKPQIKSEPSRSIWSTTLIFITLGALTVLMALFVKSLIRPHSGTPDQVLEKIETSAGHTP